MMLKILHGSIYITVMIFCSLCQAHQSSHGQISLQQSGKIMTGGWHISVDDLERSVGVDTNGDSILSWGELMQQQALIESLAKAHISITQLKTTCELGTGKVLLDKLATGYYVYLPLEVKCPQKIRKLSIKYDFLFSFDAQHKAILNIVSDELSQNTVFSNNHRVFEYDSLINNKFQAFIEFIRQGVWHIWIGLDHILFLLSLLLPAALILHQGVWHEKQSIKKTLINTTKIVTAFTLAHSVTLALSVFELVSLSSRLVESIIAASVIVASLNNIKPVIHRRLWALTFVFGLIHGLGFASVLNDVGLPAGVEGLALLGFNIGVELGQLAIVAIVLPIIYLMSSWGIYRHRILQLGSVSIAALAVIWFIERSAGVELLSWV
jgi:HupE / UreJ protein